MLRDPHVMLGIYEFCENRYREGHTFLVGVNEITFTCVPSDHMVLKVKNVLVKSVCYVTKCTICISVTVKKYGVASSS